MKKQEYHHGNLKAKLLEIAFEFLSQNSTDKLTLKVLADATNTSRSAIYRHFKSKDDLIEHMILEGFDKFDNAILNVFDNKEIPIVQRFFDGSKAYIDFAIKNPNLFRLLFGKKYAHIREEHYTIGENCNGFNALEQTIEEAQELGIAKKSDSLTQAIIIWSSLHGLATLIIDGFGDIENSYEHLHKELFQTLLAGLTLDKPKKES
jgi:AcrR family transcriptional regulator